MKLVKKGSTKANLLKASLVSFSLFAASAAMAGDMTVNGGIQQTLDTLGDSTVTVDGSVSNSIVGTQVISSEDNISVGANGDIDQIAGDSTTAAGNITVTGANVQTAVGHQVISSGDASGAATGIDNTVGGTINQAADIGTNTATLNTSDGINASAGIQLINSVTGIDNSGSTIGQTLNGEIDIDDDDSGSNSAIGAQVVNADDDLDTGTLTQTITGAATVDLDVNETDDSTTGVQVIHGDNVTVSADSSQSIDDIGADVAIGFTGTIGGGTIGLQVVAADDTLTVDAGQTLSQTIDMGGSNLTVDPSLATAVDGAVIGAQVVTTNSN